jgi:hypothetical protein
MCTITPETLAPGGSDRHRGRNPVEDQQRRGEETAADAEHAGEHADKEAERDHEDGVDRLACDRKVDVHCPSLD